MSFCINTSLRNKTHNVCLIEHTQQEVNRVIQHCLIEEVTFRELPNTRVYSVNNNFRLLTLTWGIQSVYHLLLRGFQSQSRIRGKSSRSRVLAITVHSCRWRLSFRQGKSSIGNNFTLLTLRLAHFEIALGIRYCQYFGAVCCKHVCGFGVLVSTTYLCISISKRAHEYDVAVVESFLLHECRHSNPFMGTYLVVEARPVSDDSIAYIRWEHLSNYANIGCQISQLQSKM